MHPRTRALLATLTGTTALLACAGSAWATRFSGVVVHQNPRAHSFVLAGSRGKLTAIHGRSLPRVGRRVTVTARRLHNGTWSAQHIRALGKAGQVKITGTVTYVVRGAHKFVVSVRGASLLIHVRAIKKHTPNDAADASLEVGDVVTVDGDASETEVEATQVESEGQDRNGLDLEGTVQAVDATARTLTVSADDDEASGATVTVHVPESFDLSAFSAAESVELIVSPNPDGSFTLEQASDDTGGHHADNPGESQGDDHGDQHASAEQVCRSQQSDPNFPSTHNGVSFTQFYAEKPGDANDAFGRCVDANAHGTADHPSPELQCHFEASNPNFATAHNGMTFTQVYERDPGDADNAFHRCVDSKHQEGEGSGHGSTGGSEGSGGSHSGSDG